jgi:hypothetical protein
MLKFPWSPGKAVLAKLPAGRFRTLPIFKRKIRDLGFIQKIELIFF